MKKVLIFIGLKVAEISGVIFIPWGLGLVAHSFGLFVSDPAWIAGIGMMVIPAISIIAILLFIIGNWSWAEKLSERIEK